MLQNTQKLVQKWPPRPCRAPKGFWNPQKSEKPSKWPRNEALKIHQNRKKDVKKKTQKWVFFWDLKKIGLERLGLQNGTKNDAKMVPKRCQNRKRWFCENRALAYTGARFWRVGAPQNENKIGQKTSSKTNCQKKGFRERFLAIWDFFWVFLGVQKI